tara:strand:+ start:1758 stop:1862 length:105 start_codon:yes stop_codon:yes gene_type:complete
LRGSVLVRDQDGPMIDPFDVELTRTSDLTRAGLT